MSERESGAVAERPETRARGGKFLTFCLGAEEYGIEILKVQEIIGVLPITPVPRTPEFICGVINLRGKIIPIIDIRLKLSMEARAKTEETCIIVVKARGIEMGIVVDKVSEVADIGSADIQDAPSFGAEINTDYILGIGKSENKVRMLLDIDRVLSSQDVVALRGAAGATKED